MKKLLGESFLFSRGNEIWKAKRKACAHAFYKERLTLMMDTLKTKIMEAFDRWQAEIDANNGTTIIDIFVEFERIFLATSSRSPSERISVRRSSRLWYQRARTIVASRQRLSV